MSAASKLAIVDKLLPLLESFGSSRRAQSELRKSMKAAACTQRTQPADDLPPDSRAALEAQAKCFDADYGRTPWCEACRQHDVLFSRLMLERKRNKQRLQKIERLAVAYAKPEEPETPEPKALLDLIEQQERQEAAAEEEPSESRFPEGSYHRAAEELGEGLED